MTAVGGTSLAVGKDDKYQWETGWGTEQGRAVGRRQELDRLPRRVHLGRRRRHQHDRSPSRSTSAGVVPDVARQGQRRQHADAHRAGHRGGRRPEHRLPGRPDPDLPGRLAAVQRVPHRRHLAGLRRSSRACRRSPSRRAAACRSASPTRRSTPRYGSTAYHDVTDHPLGAGRALARGPGRLRQQLDASGGLITSLRSLGEDSSLSRGRRLRRRDRRRLARAPAT